MCRGECCRSHPWECNSSGGEPACGGRTSGVALVTWLNNTKGYERKAYSLVSLRGKNAPGIQAVLNIQRLGDVLVAALDSEGEQRGRETTTVAEEGNALALSSLAVNVGEQTAQAGVDTAAVHVSAHGGDLNAGLDASSKTLLGKRHEGLLDSPVGDGCVIREILDLGGNVSEDGVRGVRDVIVVEKTSVRLGHKLASGRMESHVVETVKRCLLLLRVAVDTIAVLLRLQGCLALVVGLVASVYSLSVALDGEVAVDNRVLARQVGLVEVVYVPDVRATLTGLHDNGGVRANEHGNATSTTGGAGIALGVQRDIASDNDGITTIPSGRFDPVDRVEQSVGATVARIHCVNTLNVVVAALVEQLHENRLDRLGLVEQGLSADLEAANGLGVDVVLLEKRGHGSQGKRVDVCTEIC
jgi:hypothetical protein